jgi:hypothetical protein
VETPTQVLAGWYRDPTAEDASVMRWWSGTGWTEHVSKVDLSSAVAGPASDAPVVFDKKAHNIFVVTSVFEVLTVLLTLSFYLLHPPVFLVFCELAVAITTLILEIQKARIRKREDAIRGWHVALQLLGGTWGIVWFLLLMANVVYISMTGNTAGF